jgi:hypothetical protein
LLIYRLGSSLRPPLALALRNSAALTSTSVLRSSCLSLRACATRTRRFYASSVPAQPSNASIFQRYPCSHYGRPWSRAAFKGLALHRLMRSAPGTPQVYRSSEFCASSSRSAIWRNLFTLQRHISTIPEYRKPFIKAVGPPPLPGRWPSDPYRPVTGLRNAPLGAVLRAAPHFEVSNHRRTSASLIRYAGKGRTLVCRAIGVPKSFGRKSL